MPRSDSDTARCRRLAIFRQYLASLSVSLLGLCLGTTLGWTSPMQPLLSSPEPPVGTEPLTEDQVAWLGSVNFLGTMVGTLFWGLAADRLGRKVTTCLVAVPYLLSWSLLLAARSVTWLLVARFICGLGNSGTTVNVPVFINEVAQDSLRGFFGCFLVFFINVGVLYAYILGEYLKYYGLALGGLIIPVLFLVTFTQFPETPVFLMRSGRMEEFRRSLAWYRGGDLSETEQILAKLKFSITQKARKSTFKSLFSAKGTRKAFVIGVALMFALELSGIFTVLSFAVRIFEMCGTPISPNLSAVTIAAVHLVFSCLCSVLVDRLGRKVLLIVPLITISVSLFVLGGYLYVYENQTVTSAVKWIPLVCLSLQVIAFATGLGPVPFVIKAEIFPAEVKGLALSLIALINGALAFFVVKFFPPLKEAIHMYGCFWLYGGSSLFFAFVLAIYLPETKGKPPDIILKIFNNEKHLKGNEVNESEQLHRHKRSSTEIIKL